jgi:hypothetical protein
VILGSSAEAKVGEGEWIHAKAEQVKLMQKHSHQGTLAAEGRILVNFPVVRSDLLDWKLSAAAKQKARDRRATSAQAADELLLLQDFWWQWWGQARSRSRTEAATDWFVPAQHRLVKHPHWSLPTSPAPSLTLFALSHQRISLNADRISCSNRKLRCTAQ